MATSTLGSGTLVLAGTTSGTTTVTATAVAGTTTLTLPAATDTLVGKATTDTLTNKTLTGAVMNGTLGVTTPSTVAATTLTTSSTVTHNGGTANGVAYLDGSKVLTTGSALVFDGTNLGVGTTTPDIFSRGYGRIVGINDSGSSGAALEINSASSYPAIELGRGGVRKAFFTAQSTQTEFGNLEAVPLVFYTNSAERARIDSSGNLGIGTSSPTTPLQIQSTAATGVNSIFCTGSTTSYNFWTISNTSGNARIGVDSSSGGALATGSAAYSTVIGSPNATPLHLVSNGAVGATLDTSGNLLVGTTSNPNSCKIAIGPTASNGISIESNSTSVVMSQLLFRNPNGIVGSVSTAGSTTTYATSSDYRLKNSIVPMTSALARVLSLKPVTYKWNADDSAGEGFIAHELAEVCPDAVVGEKDAVDEEGAPRYQGIDTSFLVATLTAAIQEMKAIIDTQASTITQLQADVALLKGA